MKHFCIFENRKKEAADETAGLIRSYLEQHGADCVIRTGKLRKDTFPLEKIDCVITLGGDGTILRAARNLAGTNIPIVGVNLGHLGYMTSVSRREDVTGMLDALMRGEYLLEERMMLCGSVTHGEEKALESVALNEVVITRDRSVHTIRFRVDVNGRFLNEYASDGIIIATPTGSTAYNLSAGGPIVDPVARMMILTPMYPHALSRSSIVLRAEDRIDITITESDAASQVCVFDGVDEERLYPGSRVTVWESPETTTFINLQSGSFLDRLRSKMTVL